MKKITTALFVFSFLVIASSTLKAQSVDELNIISKERIKIVFTTLYDAEKLTELKKQLEDLQIYIEYTSLQFTEKGRLKQISAKIEYPDGKSGSFESAELQSDTTGPGFNWKVKEFKG